MDTKTATRSAGVLSIVVIAAGVIAGCSQQDSKNPTSSVSSFSSSAASSAMSSRAGAGMPTTLNVPGMGEVMLDVPTAEAYQKAGGAAKLGNPTGQPQAVADGTAQAFVNGTIYSSPDTGAHLVQGEILKVYAAHGGPGSALGFPTVDEKETGGGPDAAHGGWISEFQHGTITWRNQGDGTFKETITQK